jgi:regulator of PEP synthase PpsR (kinase-PPPase family)
MKTVFFISDHTGITVESLGHSLLAQFEGVELDFVTRRFVDTVPKGEAVAAEISRHAAGGETPIVFTTLSDQKVVEAIRSSGALVLDLFQPFLGNLAAALGQAATNRVGRLHGVRDAARYQNRIDSIDFSLATDDGLGADAYPHANIILVGVSRVGKTPTCLYLALHYGLRAANYPLADDDFARAELPKPVKSHRSKLFGLTINPLRLQQIRQKRRPGSTYSSLPQCEMEVREAENLFRVNGIPFLNTTTASVEEIAATIMQQLVPDYRLPAGSD